MLLVGRISEYRCRMISREERDPILCFRNFTSGLSHSFLTRKVLECGGSKRAYQDWFENFQLSLKIVSSANFDFVFQGLSIVGRPALDDVCNVHLVSC